MKYFLKDCTKEVLEIFKSTVIEKIKLLLLYPPKWQPFKDFAKLHESLKLNIVNKVYNIVKGAVSGLSQFLTTESP